MSNQHIVYPNLSWAQFEMYNDNKTDAFEEMCKDLFICEYLNDSKIPHANHNNPGVEVVPIQEPPRDDGQPRRFISYQAKYFDTTISNAKIIESLKQAVKHYAGRLDVIYLFCNKVISKDTDRYRKYLNILSPSNIELELVTDKDIFTLLRKYPRVADYFFQDRKRAVTGVNELMGSVPYVSSISGEATPTNPSAVQNIITQELLNEKLTRCKNAICELRFGELKSELESLSRIGAESSDGRILFYRIILAAQTKDDFSNYILELPEEMKGEAYWLLNYSRNIRQLSIEEFIGLSAEVQVVTLDLIFSTQHWRWIVELYQGRERVSHEVVKALDFHVGLAQFNLGECDLAHEILQSLYFQYHEQRFNLYDVCALLHKANRNFVFGVDDDYQNVKDLLGKLDAVKPLVTDQIKANAPMIAVLELQSCLNLGATEKGYLDEAFSRFESFSNETKANDGVRLFAGMCFEMAGDLEKASQLFSDCSWREEETLASRYLMSLINLSKPNEAELAFEELCIRTKTTRVKAIYLLALYRQKKPDYKNKLQEVIDECDQSLSDVFMIGFHVEDSAVFDEIILPKLITLIPDDLQKTDTQSKLGLLAVLAHNNKLDLIDIVLSSIADINSINRFITHDIYKCLFDIANIEYEAWRHNKERKTDLKTVEKIADRFIDAEIQKRDFLQIKLLCASANHMVFSMLKYSKALFEYTHDVQTARNIIALLYERNETNAEEYEPYLNALKDSDDPEVAMAVSAAMTKLGRFDDADFYAYKAVYLLDGTDNFNVYKSLFGYINTIMLQRKEKPVRKAISANMIVTLESEGERWVIALDSEDDFGDKDNHSLGVEHICRTDPVFVKLIGKGKKQVLILRGKRYKVVGFEPREVFLGRFIYQKVQEHPDEFKGTVWLISTENIDEMISQMHALSDNREQNKALLDAYNFDTSPIGIPIDFFVHGDYEKYIDVLRCLLNSKDLAFYAGESRLEYIVDAKYVPSLSTLVLLASKGWLDTLDWLGNHIVIPKSYEAFFREQYAVTLTSQANSAGSFVPLEDGKFTILEPNKQDPEIWEAIINKCESYPTETVLDEERIAYEISDGCTWERLFAKARIATIQLDALIVAEREKGVYLCDDLFFRKIAANKGIMNINYATLLFAKGNLDVVMPILMELSKTNYIFTPFLFRDNEEEEQLIHNLLEGEKKKAYYSLYLNAFFSIRDQIMNQYFGNSEETDEGEPN